MLDPEDRDAVLANIAIRKPKEDFAVLVELSCIYSPEELLGVRRAYQHRYKRSLEEDVAASTNDDLRTVRNLSLNPHSPPTLLFISQLKNNWVN